MSKAMRADLYRLQLFGLQVFDWPVAGRHRLAFLASFQLSLLKNVCVSSVFMCRPWPAFAADYGRAPEILVPFKIFPTWTLSLIWRR